MYMTESKKEFYNNAYNRYKEQLHLVEEKVPLFASDTRFRYVYFWAYNGYCYIGQSFNPIKRIADELSDSYNNNAYTENRVDRRAFLKDNFDGNFYRFMEKAEFKILAITDKENIDILENYYIEFYKRSEKYIELNKENYSKNNI